MKTALATAAATPPPPKLLEALRSGWSEKRRKIGKEIIREAIDNSELRPDTDAEILLDALYGPIYYRFLIAYAPLTDEYVDTIVDYVFNGVIGESLKKAANNQSCVKT